MVLASPVDVEAQPRLGNAERILRTMRPPAMGDAGALIGLLESVNGEASLAQCTAVVASPFAVERIFGLMAGGLIELDLSLPICAASRVRLPSSDRPFHWLNIQDCGTAEISPRLPEWVEPTSHPWNERTMANAAPARFHRALAAEETNHGS
jgi:hypothetical protein